MDLIAREVYVITRRLNYTVSVGFICHSALLVRVSDGNYYILEYLRANDGSVRKHFVGKVAGIKPGRILRHNKFAWKIKNNGQKIDKPISILHLETIMQGYSDMCNYDVVMWNCHMMQEATRKIIGLERKRTFGIQRLIHASPK